MSWRDLHRTKWVARWQTDKSTAQEEQRLAVASACPKWAVWRYTDSLRQEHACLISLIISLIARLSGCVCVWFQGCLRTQQKHNYISVQFLHFPGLWSGHQSRWMSTCPGSSEGVETLKVGVFFIHHHPTAEWQLRIVLKDGWDLLIGEASLFDHEFSNTQMSVELSFRKLASPSWAIWWHH